MLHQRFTRAILTVFVAAASVENEVSAEIFREPPFFIRVVIDLENFTVTVFFSVRMSTNGLTENAFFEANLPLSVTRQPFGEIAGQEIVILALRLFLAILTAPIEAR